MKTTKDVDSLSHLSQSVAMMTSQLLLTHHQIIHPTSPTLKGQAFSQVWKCYWNDDQSHTSVRCTTCNLLSCYLQYLLGTTKPYGLGFTEPHVKLLQVLLLLPLLLGVYQNTQKNMQWPLHVKESLACCEHRYSRDIILFYICHFAQYSFTNNSSPFVPHALHISCKQTNKQAHKINVGI